MDIPCPTALAWVDILLLIHPPLTRNIPENRVRCCSCSDRAARGSWSRLLGLRKRGVLPGPNYKGESKWRKGGLKEYSEQGARVGNYLHCPSIAKDGKSEEANIITEGR